MAVAVGFLISLLAAWVLVHTQSWHLHLTGDRPEDGPQKLHDEPTPRIGGVAILLGLSAALLCLAGSGGIAWRSVQFLGLVPLLLCFSPLFVLGLIEDVQKATSVRLRLLVSFGSGALAWWLVDVRVTALGLPALDAWLLTYPVLSLFFSVFAIGGLVHAMNIVDGLNGLLAGIALVTFAAIAWVAQQAGDVAVVWVALAMMAAVIGFAVWNFPSGRLFCGDAGAYLIGFMVATLVILLVHRQHGVSPWFALTVVAHPVVETLHSAWRRARRGLSATLPDASHLHSLWAARLKSLERLRGEPVFLGPNAGGAVRTLAAAVAPTVLAALAARDTFWLQVIFCAHVVVFVALTRWLESARPYDAPAFPATEPAKRSSV